jgi:ribonuclease Z
MLSHLEEAYAYDIRIRPYDEKAPPDGVVILAEDVSEELIYDSSGVKKAAFEVDHSPIKPVFGRPASASRDSTESG